MCLNSVHLDQIKITVLVVHIANSVSHSYHSQVSEKAKHFGFYRARNIHCFFNRKTTMAIPCLPRRVHLRNILHDCSGVKHCQFRTKEAPCDQQYTDCGDVHAHFANRSLEAFGFFLTLRSMCIFPVLKDDTILFVCLLCLCL